MDVKVSIIIPVYNIASYLDICLSSCINQTFRNVEIIVVNDGSQDDSARIIDRYAAMDDRVRVITKENQGLIYARKSGLDMACGEYVFHLDGDDYLEINAIEELYNEARESGADYVIGNYYNVRGEDKYEIRNNSFNGLSGQDLLLNMLYKGFRIFGKLIRKSLFNDLVYYPTFMGEDLFFNMQISLKVKKAAVVDKCLYDYVFRPSSVTNQKKEISWERNVVMVKSIFYLLDVYSYNQQIVDRIYLMFFPFYLSGISHQRLDVKSLLYDYYWSKKEVMDFLWGKNKKYYLMIYLFFNLPSLGCLTANVYSGILAFKHKCGRILFLYRNKCGCMFI